MKILIEHPPFWQEVLKHFKVDESKTLFTYGDIIYNPGNTDIPDHLLTHEKVHQYQQKRVGKDLWWQKYFTDPTFRLEQEIEAFIAQYRHICKLTKDRNERSRIFEIIVNNLSGEMYGRMVDRHGVKMMLKQALAS